MPREFRHRTPHQVDFSLYEPLLREKFTQLYKEATIAYVQAGAKNIPSLTGQARASVIAATKSLGLNIGIGPEQPPHSSNRNQRQRLMRAGNTAARGFSLGVVTITVDKKSARWRFQNTLTSAHNNYPYMDEDQWDAFSEGKAALKAYIESNMDRIMEEIIREMHNGF